jgi:hypothetical protein
VRRLAAAAVAAAVLGLGLTACEVHTPAQHCTAVVNDLNRYGHRDRLQTVSVVYQAGVRWDFCYVNGTSPAGAFHQHVVRVRAADEQRTW